MNQSQRNRHEPAYQRLSSRWGWLFGRQSRTEREAAMAEFADMPDELQRFVVAECSFAQVQAIEELRVTVLHAFKVALMQPALGEEPDEEQAVDEEVPGSPEPTEAA